MTRQSQARRIRVAVVEMPVSTCARRALAVQSAPGRTIEKDEVGQLHTCGCCWVYPYPLPGPAGKVQTYIIIEV